MKRPLFILSLLALAFAVNAQDQQILSQRDWIGTARYVGMAGAMTAVGGDPSAVNDNPAGLGVFRRWDVSLSLFVKPDHVYLDGQNIGAVTKFSASQASFVFGWTDPTKVRGLITNNVMISYHNLANFDRHYTCTNTDIPFSLADVIAAKTNGVEETALQPAERWGNQNWLSNMAYDTYLISPDATDTKRWYAVLDPGQLVSKSKLTMREYGRAEQFSLSWGGNISNRVYLGATLNIISIDHTQSVEYYEIFGDDCSLDNNSYVHHSGVGVNGAVGIIAHPVQFLRIGASFITPSAVSLTTNNYGDMKSALFMTNPKTGLVEKTANSVSTPNNRYTDRAWSTPLRSSIGVAFQALHYGLASFQYDYAHHKNMDDVHTLKVGLEGVIVDRFFLNLGYAYESSFLKANQYTAGVLPVNTARTDAYSQYIRFAHYASAGFGYHGSLFTIHAAYRYRWQKGRTFTHELAEPNDWYAVTHDIVLTLDFHTR